MGPVEYKKAIAATFDDVSARYDENKFFAISAGRMAELVPFSESMGILDVSTGTGVVAIELARKYPHAKIEAIYWERSSWHGSNECILLKFRNILLMVLLILMRTHFSVSCLCKLCIRPRTPCYRMGYSLSYTRVGR
jgi:hypothetical protein